MARSECMPIVNGGQAKAEARIQKITPRDRGVHIPIKLNSCVSGPHMEAFVRENAHTHPMRVIQPNSRNGRRLALCGAGPSLTDNLPIRGIDDIWACNSALPFLMSRGVPVTAGVGIDQSPALQSEWASCPETDYLLATSVDPSLVRFLQQRGRQVTFFHSFVGFAEDEFDVYCRLYPPTLMLGEGATVLSRAVAAALWMGYERVDVYGGDGAFGDDDVAYADGRTAEMAYGQQPLILTGEHHGRVYRTRPDMLFGAVDLAKLVQRYPGRVR